MGVPVCDLHSFKWKLRIIVRTECHALFGPYKYEETIQDFIRRLCCRFLVGLAPLKPLMIRVTVNPETMDSTLGYIIQKGRIGKGIYLNSSCCVLRS